MLTGIQKVRVAAQIGRSVRTVDRVYRGLGNAYSRDAVTRAALQLGFPAPPVPSSESSPALSSPNSRAA
jgi:hypothetical protein